MDVLALQVDPLSYKENLTMPKLVVDATGDEFFQVQDDGTLLSPSRPPHPRSLPAPAR